MAVEAFLAKKKREKDALFPWKEVFQTLHYVRVRRVGTFYWAPREQRGRLAGFGHLLTCLSPPPPTTSFIPPISPIAGPPLPKNFG